MHQVMVVDDEAPIREAAAMLLEDCGYKVVKASNGRACLENLRNGFHGLILLDNRMPQMGGWETIRNMVQEDLLKHNLICMLSGMDTPGPEAESLGKHVFARLMKPCTADDLTQVVKNAANVLDSEDSCVGQEGRCQDNPAGQSCFR